MPEIKFKTEKIIQILATNATIWCLTNKGRVFYFVTGETWKEVKVPKFVED